MSDTNQAAAEETFDADERAQCNRWARTLAAAGISGTLEQLATAVAPLVRESRGVIRAVAALWEKRSTGSRGATGCGHRRPTPSPSNRPRKPHAPVLAKLDRCRTTTTEGT